MVLSQNAARPKALNVASPQVPHTQKKMVDTESGKGGSPEPLHALERNLTGKGRLLYCAGSPLGSYCVGGCPPRVSV